MTISVWPSTLPQLPLRDGYSESFGDTIFRTEMEYGPAKQRRRATAVPRPVNWPIHLVNSDTLEILIDFYHDTLLGGTKPFQHYHPRTLDGTERNMLSYSEDFTAPIWSYWYTSVSADVTTGPDGVTPASKLVEDDSFEPHGIAYLGTELSNNDIVTWSNHFKAVDADRDAVRATIYKRDNTGVVAAFDLVLGTNYLNSEGVTGAISAAGNDWYRVSATLNIGSGGHVPTLVWQMANADPLFGEEEWGWTGDGTSGVYIWGAQLELGSLTDYKVTTGAPTPKFLLRFTSAPTITPSGLGYWVDLPLEIMP